METELDRHELVKGADGTWECQATGCAFADMDLREVVAHAVAHQERE